MFLLFFQTIARRLGVRARAAHGCPLVATAQISVPTTAASRAAPLVVAGTRTALPLRAAASTTLAATATATLAVV